MPNYIFLGVIHLLPRTLQMNFFVIFAISHKIPSVLLTHILSEVSHTIFSSERRKGFCALIILKKKLVPISNLFGKFKNITQF
jgi:hypothetical protein